MDRIVLHIDVNNAFLSWSAVDYLKKGNKLDYRTIVSVVGHERGRSGIVLAKSVPAKKMGIVTPEPIFKSRKKVSNLVVVEPDYKLYSEMSNMFFSYLERYFEKLEKFSIDECFIEYTSYFKLYKDPYEFALKLKDEIYNELGFTVNIGIGNNKLCAKMASNFKKPNMVHTLYKDEIESKMWPLDVENLFMVGKKTSIVLKEMGIVKIKDLAKCDDEILIKRFKNNGIKLKSRANGIDNSKVGEIPKNQNISKSITFETDLLDIEEINLILRKLVCSVSLSLRKKNILAKTIAINIKTKEFVNKNRQKKVLNATNSNEEIYKIASKLLNDVFDSSPIRLLGISVSNFTKNQNIQLSMFEDLMKKENDKELQKVIDKINFKYQSKVIYNANFYDFKDKK